MGHLRYLAVPLLAITLSCGATATPSSTRTISLNDQNAGQTVQARSGDTVKVALQEGSPVPGSSLTWSVTSGAPSILRGVAVHRTTPVTSGPSRQDTYTATFEAASAGQATLIAHGSTTCEAMAKPQCPNRDFTITVVVSA